MADTRYSTAGRRWPLIGELSMWKLLVLQDIIILGGFGVAALWFPASLLTFQAKVAGFIGWPPASWLTKSDTIVMLLDAIGAVALGFCIPLMQAILTNDTNFGASLALYHTALAGLLYYAMSVGGSAHKALLPFIGHNALTAAGLFLTLPAGKFQSLMGKVHIA